MLSASIWVFLFIIAVAGAMKVRKQIRKHKSLRDWYENRIKDRLNLIKKIFVYGTLILWIGIWLATRGDEKSSVSTLLKEFTSSWTKQETPLAEPKP